MSASRLHRRSIAGVAALVAIGILAAGCTKSGSREQQPTTTPRTITTPTSSIPSPTQKSLSPTTGNLFTPPTPHPPAPPPATLPPGSFPGIYSIP
jgi:hypothetical protein